jgi:ubiquinol-cytochrome c reductase iron-sulfur subunit
MRESPRTAGAIGVALISSALASLGLTVVYVLGGQPQAEGILLGVALGGLGVGLILWAKQFMPVGHAVQTRSLYGPTPQEREAAEDTFEAGADLMARRGFLLRLLGAAVAALGLAALFPIRSLGGSPGRTLFETAWKPGARMVTLEGRPVRPEDMGVGSVLTVYPEGHEGSADAQALLIGLEQGRYRAIPGREEWAPGGLVAFSKLCTHAGCPVGLYQPSSHQLFCPCHQSVFDVLEGAAPTQGPATRPLPQLPVSLGPDGFLAAGGDFSAPVGPGFWNRPSGA